MDFECEWEDGEYGDCGGCGTGEPATEMFGRDSDPGCEEEKEGEEERVMEGAGGGGGEGDSDFASLEYDTAATVCSAGGKLLQLEQCRDGPD